MSDKTSRLQGKDIVCIATQEWDSHWTPVQHVMAGLAATNRVIYIEPFHVPLAWLRRRHRFHRDQLESGVEQLREVQPNVFVYRPSAFYLPFNWRSKIIMALNQPIYRAEINALLKRLDVKKPWIWPFFSQGPAIFDLDYECLIYDCVDEWAAFHTNPAEQKIVADLDRKLCERADLVFVGSAPLLESKRGYNPKTFMVNHAADIEHFMKAAAPDTVVPGDLASIPGLRIGFVGMVDRVRFDFELIEKLADNPDNQVVIVGGFVDDADQLFPQRDNLHLLGMKPIDALPAYIKGLDVCLMPYRLNEATRNIYPLKLHEYMATGKPVVATPIPAVEEFRDLLYVVDDLAEYSSVVARAAAEDDPDLVERRKACAREHSWEAHVAEKVNYIEENLAE